MITINETFYFTLVSKNSVNLVLNKYTLSEIAIEESSTKIAVDKAELAAQKFIIEHASLLTTASIALNVKLVTSTLNTLTSDVSVLASEVNTTMASIDTKITAIEN